MIILRGKTRHGKCRIEQHGKQWRIMRDAKFRGDDAWLLQSMQKTNRGGFDCRWVLKQNDSNFEVIK